MQPLPSCGGEAAVGGEAVVSERVRRPGLLATRVQLELLKKLDAWRLEHPDLPSRPEALRRLAEEELRQAGVE